MALLDELNKQARELSHQAFCEAQRGVYLVGSLQAVAGAAPQMDAHKAPQMDAHKAPTFSTSTTQVRIPAVSMAPLGATGQGVDLDRFVLRVARADEGQEGERKRIGRTSDNDVIITHPSVSKRHAYFIFGPLSRNRDSRSFSLEDAGSRNGTSLSGQRLVRGEAITVRPGAHLIFGHILCEFLDEAGLYSRLSPPP